MDRSDDVTQRPLDRGQLRGWANLVAAMEAVDHQDEHLGEEDLAEEFDDPEADYEPGSVAMYSGHTMIGFSVLSPRTAAEPVHEIRLDGGVLEGHCLARNEGAVALFSAHGYAPTRWFLRMSCELTPDLPAAQVPAGIQVVGFTPDRSDDARLVRDDAFRDHWGSTKNTDETWAHFVGYGAFRPAYSFLAYEGSEPLGVIVSHEYDSYTRATGRRELYIPTVGTRRAGRNRGIATALLSHTLRAARADGLVSATLDVDADSPTGAVGLYQRAGFVLQDTWIAQVKRLIG